MTSKHFVLDNCSQIIGCLEYVLIVSSCYLKMTKDKVPQQNVIFKIYLKIQKIASTEVDVCSRKNYFPKSSHTGSVFLIFLSLTKILHIKKHKNSFLIGKYLMNFKQKTFLFSKCDVLILWNLLHHT